MRHKDLPRRWQNKIEEYLQKRGSQYNELSLDDFPRDSNLRIKFEDGSTAFFKDSFYWIDEEQKEVAVFTEHCGYHIFYLPEILIETLNWKGKIIKTEDYRTE